MYDARFCVAGCWMPDVYSGAVSVSDALTIIAALLGVKSWQADLQFAKSSHVQVQMSSCVCCLL